MREGGGSSDSRRAGESGTGIPVILSQLRQTEEANHAGKINGSV